MPRDLPLAARQIAPAIAVEGALAGLITLALLAWRGTIDAGHAFAPLNAPAHWLFGQPALRADQPSWRYTGTGVATHLVSSAFCAGLYAWIRSRRKRRTAVNAVFDAAAVTATAAVVDLRLVPDRITPGFERRLSSRGLVAVYAGLALGLAMGGLLVQRK